MRSVSSSIVLPVSAAAAFRVLTDLDIIIRLSPFFTLKNIEPPSGGVTQKGDCCRLTIEYYANKMTVTHDVAIERLEMNRLISYDIGNGILTNIAYELEPAGSGIQLTQTFRLNADDEAILKGSQYELHRWLQSVGEYVRLADGTSPLKKVQKMFMDKIWLGLSISERNIAIIMIKISAVELVLLLVLVLIWHIGLSR